MSVVLPAPLGPATATISPGRTSSETSSSSVAAPMRTATPVARVRHRASSPRSRSSSHRKNGAPDERGDDADRELDRREEAAREHVGDDQQRAPSSAEPMATTRCDWPTQARTRLGTIRATKAMTPAVATATAVSSAKSALTTSVSRRHVDAEMAGLLFAQRQRVQAVVRGGPGRPPRG